MNLRFQVLPCLAAVFFLAGCEEPAPAVSDYNGDSVRIQQSTIFAGANHKAPGVESEAVRICKLKGKKAEYASTRMGPDNLYAEHFFLCL